MAVNQSIFGATPDELQMAREQALQQQALQYAQLNPFQQASMGMFMAGNRVGGAFGGVPPEVNLLKQRQALLQGVDINDPVSLRAAAQKALQANDYRAAQELATKAAEVEKASVERRKDESVIAKNTSDKLTPEQKNAAAVADTVADRGTPEWTKAYSEHLTRLTTTKDKDHAWKEVGVTTDGSKRAVYVDQNTGTQFVFGDVGPDGKQQKIPYVGGIDRSTARVSATANAYGSEQEKEFDKARGKNDAEILAEAQKTAAKSAQALNTLAGMERKNVQGIYSGPQAQVVKESANLLESLGLLSPAQTKKLTDATVYDKSAKDLVMQDLDGKLGAQVSDADRKYVEARIPQLTTNPQARTELIAKLKEIHMGKIDRYRKMNDYANKNKNLNGFDLGEVPAAAASKPAADPLGLRR